MNNIQITFQNDDEIKLMEKNLSDIQKKNFDELLLKPYYTQAHLLQVKQNIKCLDSEEDSVAKKNNFPHNFQNKKNIEKLFMCDRRYFELNDFVFKNFGDYFLKYFFI